MENPYKNIRNLKLPSKNEVRSAIFSFSKKEWFIFLGLAVVLFVSTLIILESINKSFMTGVPMRGGSISEGIIGTPRFINPILALSDADQDLVSLVYSGLMRKNTDGTLIPDLAEKYEMSKDGLSYTFTLKNKIYFQNSKPVTIEDILFTINEVKDPIIKSPYKANWEGVNVEKIDDKTIKFNLKQPYASFLENTTFGIMPAHIWNGSPIELNDANTNPIGSGPFQVANVNKQSSGLINYYDLKSFKKFILGYPYLKQITLRFYPNENDLISALEKGEVDQISSMTPANTKILKEKKYRIESSVLPRVFGLFFNQNQAQIFTDKHIIEAIDQAIDKDKIVNEVLEGYGVAIDEPIPPNMIEYQKLSTENNSSHEEKLKKAQEILTKDGWKKNSDGFLEKTISDKKKKTKSTTNIEFSISTGNAPELSKSAELIKQDLESIGMKVDIKTFEIGNLNQGVIRPRKYDALLFGQIINHESDLFAFWHSSQRNDPGLNVAMYTNSKVDKILEDAFTIIDEKSRIKKYAQFEDEIKKDMPAVFLYSPNFLYIVSKNLGGLSINHITSPSDRFLNSYLWYTQKDNVWKIFSK
ncbi:MAG: peptide ABC transporter substrate-binding protein [Candidatus Paceibacterota bacterium]|jgi:peptide/nickel transport system substrate-binding protein